MGKNYDEFTSMGKFIALVLRHKPEIIGIKIEYFGAWANAEELLRGIQKSGKHIDMQMLEDIVKKDNKKRYSFNFDKTKIRANQGHSIPVDLGLEIRTPPDKLYHGTAQRFIESIKEKGILKMSRNYVHLSKDPQYAAKIGSRHGKPAVIELDVENMKKDNINFYISENNIWMCDYVAPKYLKF